MAEILRRQFRHGEPALPLRHTARDALQRTNLDKTDATWIDDVLIVISELIQNVSQHTLSHGELIVSIESTAVLIEVGDTSNTVPHTHDPDPQRTGGRGLRLVEAICQQWGVRTCRNGKVVWARLAVPTTVAVPGAA